MKKRSPTQATGVRAKWLIDPGLGTIENAAIVSAGHKLVYVGPFVGAPAARWIDLGDVVVTPGFVNAHAHLDLEPLRLPPAKAGFVPWLEAVVRQRREATAESIQKTVEKNIAALLASGTTLVADIAASKVSERLLRASRLKAIVFREVIGRRPERYRPLVRWAGKQRSATPTIRFRKLIAAASPHAPFSTSPKAFGLLAKSGGLLATHWRESAEEIEFLTRRGGPLHEFLNSLGALETGFDPKGASLEKLERHFLRQGARWLLIHASELDAGALSRLARPPIRRRLAGVVYCPRTHAYFQRPPHPWQRIESAGIPVVLGTDGLASNPDLAVYNEAKFLFATDKAASPAWLLDAVTAKAARALGWDRWCGSLQTGRRADFVVVALPSGIQANPLESLFAKKSQVVGVFVDGVSCQIANGLAG